jgi:uncharacterized NAD(P)/FAD-binding protein YdhS
MELRTLLDTKREARRTVVIIGGGFTGAAIAHHLDRRAPGLARIVVVEPRASLGAGLAYSTEDPAHRINVPASRMSLDPEQPQHFENWLVETGALRDDPESRLADGRSFPRRTLFGRYVGEQLSEAISVGRLEHRRDSVTKVTPRTDGYGVSLSKGETLEATIVIIASTHPPPSAPAALRRALAGDKRFIAEPALANALDVVSSSDRVLIVGAGLTMADIVASLDRRGHKGVITALSRHEQLPGQHAERVAPSFGNFLIDPSRTAVQLLCAVRETVDRAEAQGLPWQSVFDALREQGRGIWMALEPSERRRALRHLRSYWDARRFRVAPQVQAVLKRRRREGTFRSMAGVVRAVRPSTTGLPIVIRSRGAEIDSYCEFDRIVVATGPAHSDISSAQPYLARLEADGMVAVDRLGLGLAVDLRGRAVGRLGQTIETLLVGGPLARGTFGELMGLPEVSRYAVEIAGEVAALLSDRSHIAQGFKSSSLFCSTGFVSNSTPGAESQLPTLPAKVSETLLGANG